MTLRRITETEVGVKLVIASDGLGIPGPPGPVTNAALNAAAAEDPAATRAALELGSAALLTGTQALLENKPRLQTVVSPAVLTPTADQDLCQSLGQSGPLTIAAPTGSPSDGQKLLIRLRDEGVAAGLTFNAIYRSMGSSLPITTAANKLMRLGFEYNATDAKWDLIAYDQES